MTKFFSSAMALAVMVCGLALTSAQASLVTYESRYDDGSAVTNTAQDYKDNWDSLASSPATPGYGGPVVVPSWNSGAGVNNQGLIPGGSAFDIASKYTLEFDIAPGQEGFFEVRFGLDYGRGFAAFFNGAPAFVNTGDVWWGFDWNNPSLTGSGFIAPGHYTLEIYGREGGADGPTAGEFRFGGTGDFTPFGANDNLGVPEPSSVVLLGLGGIGMGLAAWRRRRAAVA
jgi:hypothetical protein